MSINGRSLFIAIGLLAVGVVAYGPLTRPEVPTPVAKTIAHFAPGVAIATTVDQSAKTLSGLRWVEDRGWIGKPSAPYVDQVRLVPKRTTTGQLAADRDAKVESVEFVVLKSDAMNSTIRNLAITFDTTQFSEGCLDPVGDGYPYRQVRYFTTRHDRGGAAVVNDYRTEVIVRADTTPRPWSIITWTGKFAGSSTLRGAYQPVPCKQLTGK